MNPHAVAAKESPLNLSQRAHRITIGALGILLPVMVYLLAGFRYTDGLEPWRPLESVSAYYYTGGVAALVGVLFAMSLFLFTYPGYEGFVWDSVVGKVAGVAGWGIALFPARAPHGAQRLCWWCPYTGVIHYVSALILFVAFAVFALWLFRRSSVPDKRARLKCKQTRDTICLVCGVSILVGLVWTGLAHLAGRSMLLPESLAIVAFSISWLAKGEVVQAATDAVRGMKAKAQG